MAEVHVPSSDFKVEIPQGGMKAAIAETGAKVRDLLMVPVDQIRTVAGMNVRIHDADYEAHVESLRESIVEHGFWQHMPIPGYAGKEGDQTFIYATGGFSRLEAVKRAILAGTPIEVLPVVLKPAGTSMLDLTFALAGDNTGKPLKPYERAIVVKRAVGYGAEPATIATKMGITEQYVNDLLYLMGLPQSIQQMVIDGRVSAHNAVVTARKNGAEAVKVLQDAAGPAPEPASTANGSTAPSTAGKATPRATKAAGAASTVVTRKLCLTAIDYAIALDSLEWLGRWRKGEQDAVKELASYKAPRKNAAVPKAKAKAKAKAKSPGRSKKVVDPVFDTTAPAPAGDDDPL